MITCEICLDEVPASEMYDAIGCKRCARTEYGPTAHNIIITIH